MRTSILAALLLTATAHAQSTGSAGSTENPKPSLKADWEALITSGCKLAAAHVYTPIEASALRNTPYALKGYVFKTGELKDLFGADGGWYTPDPTVKEPVFSPAETECIKKIKDLESSLEGKMTKAFKTRFLGQHDEVMELRSHTALMEKGHITITPMGNGYELTCPACEGLRILQLFCESDACHLLAPGI